MRAFAISDSVVLDQIQELERLCEQDGGSGEFQRIDTLILAAIGTIKALPIGISAKIYTSFYVGNAHVDGPSSERLNLWNRLRSGLARDLDRLAADTTLSQVNLADQPYPHPFYVRE